MRTDLCSSSFGDVSTANFSAVELHVYPGAPHMFDQYPGAITEQSARDIARALQRMIANP